MEGLERILTMLDRSLNTRKKRHVAGGVLMSISLLFGELALTVMTTRQEEAEPPCNEGPDDDIYLE